MKKNKVSFVVDHLSAEDKDKFLRELLMAQASKKDISPIIESWEATAEINAIPGMKQDTLLNSILVRKHLLQKNRHA